uniref:Transmembrane protein n=1 Tax=Palpitomonas bilix TaxID=652834 RepID=A0A7S3GK88_9EUKA|mmetsp:Transcript_6980/g.17825  ORF Transcript_6980/g.17825 Transcript_6980/m.17825 type:complete len:1377 (+) Transcript_6980:431-4561(+)
MEDHYEFVPKEDVPSEIYLHKGDIKWGVPNYSPFFASILPNAYSPGEIIGMFPLSKGNGDVIQNGDVSVRVVVDQYTRQAIRGPSVQSECGGMCWMRARRTAALLAAAPSSDMNKRSPVARSMSLTADDFGVSVESEGRNVRVPFRMEGAMETFAIACDVGFLPSPEYQQHALTVKHTQNERLVGTLYPLTAQMADHFAAQNDLDCITDTGDGAYYAKHNSTSNTVEIYLKSGTDCRIGIHRLSKVRVRSPVVNEDTDILTEIIVPYMVTFVQSNVLQSQLPEGPFAPVCREVGSAIEDVMTGRADRGRPFFWLKGSTETAQYKYELRVDPSKADAAFGKLFHIPDDAKHQVHAASVYRRDWAALPDHMLSSCDARILMVNIEDPAYSFLQLVRVSKNTSPLVREAFSFPDPNVMGEDDANYGNPFSDRLRQSRFDVHIGQPWSAFDAPLPSLSPSSLSVVQEGVSAGASTKICMIGKYPLAETEETRWTASALPAEPQNFSVSGVVAQPVLPFEDGQTVLATALNAWEKEGSEAVPVPCDAQLLRLCFAGRISGVGLLRFPSEGSTGNAVSNSEWVKTCQRMQSELVVSFDASEGQSVVSLDHSLYAEDVGERGAVLLFYMALDRDQSPLSNAAGDAAAAPVITHSVWVGPADKRMEGRYRPVTQVASLRTNERLFSDTRLSQPVEEMCGNNVLFEIKCKNGFGMPYVSSEEEGHNQLVSFPSSYLRVLPWAASSDRSCLRADFQYPLYFRYKARLDIDVERDDEAEKYIEIELDDDVRKMEEILYAMPFLRVISRAGCALYPFQEQMLPLLRPTAGTALTSPDQKVGFAAGKNNVFLGCDRFDNDREGCLPVAAVLRSSTDGLPEVSTASPVPTSAVTFAKKVGDEMVSLTKGEEDLPVRAKIFTKAFNTRCVSVLCVQEKSSGVQFSNLEPLERATVRFETGRDALDVTVYPSPVIYVARGKEDNTQLEVQVDLAGESLAASEGVLTVNQKELSSVRLPPPQGADMDVKLQVQLDLFPGCVLRRDFSVYRLDNVTEGGIQATVGKSGSPVDTSSPLAVNEDRLLAPGNSNRINRASELLSLEAGDVFISAKEYLPRLCPELVYHHDGIRLTVGPATDVQLSSGSSYTQTWEADQPARFPVRVAQGVYTRFDLVGSVGFRANKVAFPAVTGFDSENVTFSAAEGVHIKQAYGGESLLKLVPTLPEAYQQSYRMVAVVDPATRKGDDQFDLNEDNELVAIKAVEGSGEYTFAFAILVDDTTYNFSLTITGGQNIQASQQATFTAKVATGVAIGLGVVVVATVGGFGIYKLVRSKQSSETSRVYSNVEDALGTGERKSLINRNENGIPGETARVDIDERLARVVNSKFSEDESEMY